MFEPAATPWSCQKPRTDESVEVKDSSAVPFRNVAAEAAAGSAIVATAIAATARPVLIDFPGRPMGPT